MIAVSSLCSVLAVGAIVYHPVVADTQIPVLDAATEELVRVPVAAHLRRAAPPPASNELLFVFRVADETYVKLGGAELVPEKHGPRRMVEDEGVVATVADVVPSALPARLRRWETKELAVDGACRARVTGFAVVTRLVGDPGYAGLDDEKWTVDTAAAKGADMLVARIDDCHDGTYARDAAVAPILTLDDVEDPALIATARSAFLASDAARDAAASWEEERTREAAGGSATAGTGLWIDHVTVTARVVRHPKTGVKWVAIHTGGERMCGGPDINVWGLFRVMPDGALETVHVRKLDTLYAIERIIDIDDDGTPELVGNDWLGMSRLLTRADGDEVDRLAMPFHGCPC